MVLGQELDSSSAYLWLQLLLIIISLKGMALEPDYRHLVYGKVWRHVVPFPTSYDVERAVESALDYVTRKASFKPKSLVEKICLNKLDLWYTENEVSPDSASVLDDKDNEQCMPLSFGVMYNIVFVYSEGPSKKVHYLTVTREVSSEKYFIFCYTFYKTDENVLTMFYNTNHAFVASELNVVSPFSSNKNLFFRFPYESIPKNLSRSQDKSTCQREAVAKGRLRLNLMSYNIWNYFVFNEYTNKKYEDRIGRLIQIVEKYDPDIIGFQEVRLEMQRGGELGPNQVQHLASKLQKYQYVYQPAMMHGNSLTEGRTEEGVAIFSKYPIVYFEYLFIFRDKKNSADPNQRVCLHAVVQVPGVGQIHIYNTHLSLSHEARERSASQIMKFMNITSGPAFLTGDLNATPDEKSIKMLTSDSNLKDTWSELKPNIDGYTYSTLKENLSKRLDYIFHRQGGGVTPVDVVVCDDDLRSNAASDHRAIMATFEITHD